MAIDSEVKRKSIAAIANPWNGPVIVPSGSIDGPDRQAIGWSYSGIAAGLPAETVFVAFMTIISASDRISVISGSDSMEVKSGDNTISVRSEK